MNRKLLKSYYKLLFTKLFSGHWFDIHSKKDFDNAKKFLEKSLK